MGWMTGVRGDKSITAATGETWALTGSPGVWMFEGEREAVVYGCQLDDGILYYHPVCVLGPGGEGPGRQIFYIKVYNFVSCVENWVWKTQMTCVCPCVLTLFPTGSIGQSYFTSQLSFPLSGTHTHTPGSQCQPERLSPRKKQNKTHLSKLHCPNLCCGTVPVFLMM